MIIAKFGGTSLKDGKAFQQVVQIIINLKKKAENQDILVVNSASAQVTNKLSQSFEQASKGNDEYLKHIIEVANKYKNIATEIINSAKITEILKLIDNQINNLIKILEHVFITNSSDLIYKDKIVSYGEYLASQILYYYLNQLEKTSKYLNATDFIITDNNFGNAKVDFKQTQLKIENFFNNRNIKQKKQKQIFIISGFIGSTNKGEITTLGREGSDYSAALLAYFLEVKELQYWKDVDGIMDRDPKLYKNAKLINSMSITTAIEFAQHGSTLIYLPALILAQEKNIVIKIKNTFKPQNQGSIISINGKQNHVCFISTDNLSLFKFSLDILKNKDHSLCDRIIAILYNTIELIDINKINEYDFTLLIKSKDNNKLIKLIKDKLTDYLDSIKINQIDNLAKLVVIGDFLNKKNDLLLKFIDAIKNDIDFKIIYTKIYQKNLLLVLNEIYLDFAVSQLSVKINTLKV